MSTIVQQIGKQLADSIMSHLNTSSPTATVHASHEETCNTKASFPVNTLDLSQVQLVTRRGVKDPPVFRGESSDALAVDEWEELMKNYVRKNDVQLSKGCCEIWDKKW